MRRKQRIIRNAAIMAGGLTAVVDIMQQSAELRSSGGELTWQNVNLKRTLEKTIMGATAGGIVGYLYYLYNVSQESTHSFDPDGYLEKILREESLKNDPKVLSRMLQCRELLKIVLREMFNGKLASPPENAGSLYKRTAIRSRYDVDIILAFKKNAYYTLEQMYDDVYEKLRRRFGDNATVTEQTRSIGITFDFRDMLIPIDIVPGREINNYRIDKMLNLYVKPDWFWQRGSSHKTDVFQQQKITCNRPEARKVIKLLKIYRNRYEPSLSSTVIEHCATDALSPQGYGIYSSVTENLLNCMDWLTRKLSQAVLRDPANSNNNLHKKISGPKKSALCALLESDIRKVESDPRYLREIFEL